MTEGTSKRIFGILGLVIIGLILSSVSMTIKSCFLEFQKLGIEQAPTEEAK
jgi:hypothetical protein